MTLISLVVQLRIQGITWPLLAPLCRPLLLVYLLNLLAQLLLPGRLSFTITTYSSEHLIMRLLLALPLPNKVLILFLAVLAGVLLEDLVLIDGGDARAREHWLALPTVPLDRLDRDDHLYFI